MKKQMLTLTALFLLTTAALIAQPAGPGGPPSPQDDNPVGVPIDGGAGLLLLAGGAIAAFKYLRKKKE